MELNIGDCITVVLNSGKQTSLTGIYRGRCTELGVLLDQKNAIYYIKQYEYISKESHG